MYRRVRIEEFLWNESVYFVASSGAWGYTFIVIKLDEVHFYIRLLANLERDA
ncbi:MAG: hypothetical protein JNJ85_02230 [Candidatus Kapabacteria bacterium]|nr:hypothetical protein [Candidatus Kapabacteria bacterium]